MMVTTTIIVKYITKCSEACREEYEKVEMEGSHLWHDYVVHYPGVQIRVLLCWAFPVRTATQV